MTDDRLRYGDDCPVCGRPVKTIVESRPCGNCGRVDGPRVYNGECAQHGEDGVSRYIFHQESSPEEADA
jgi:hypothetical protein